MRRRPAVLGGLLLALLAAIAVAPAAHAAPATEPPATVQLLDARLDPSGTSLVLRHHVVCPAGPPVAFLSAIVTQSTDAGVVQSQNFREVTCSGDQQTFRVEVASSPSGDFAVGRALVQSEISLDNEPGSWQGTESAAVRLVPGRVREASALLSDSLGSAPPTGDAQYLDANVKVVSAGIVARGAGVVLAHNARCPKNFFSYLFPTVEQGDVAAPGVSEFYCTGSEQQLVTIVALPEGPPLRPGPATVSTLLNNCPEDVGCFRATDTSSVNVQRGIPWWEEWGEEPGS